MANFHLKDNYFYILGLPQHAPPRAITKAYKRLVLTCHPDKNPNCPPGFGAMRFNKIMEAYRYLMEYRDYIDYYGAVHQAVHPYILWQKDWMQRLERSAAITREMQDKINKKKETQQRQNDEEEREQGLQMIIWTPLRPDDHTSTSEVLKGEQ